MARQTITAERRVVTERRRVESVQFGCCPLCSTVSVWSDVGSVAMRLTAGRAEERRRKGAAPLVSRSAPMRAVHQCDGCGSLSCRDRMQLSECVSMRSVCVCDRQCSVGSAAGVGDEEQ